MENTCKIGIIVAMRSELEKLAGMMIAPETKKIGAHEFTSGKLAGKDVILACCGVGKVNAAACTAGNTFSDSMDCFIYFDGYKQCKNLS